MNFLRYKIIQRLAFSLLGLGMVAHFAIPLSSQAQKTSFINWLSQNVVSETTAQSDVRVSIRQLPYQTEDFSLLLAEASQLVANNHNEFRIPKQRKAEVPASNLGQWLIDQWSAHNQHNKPNAVLPDVVQPYPKWTVQLDHFSALQNNSKLLFSSDFKVQSEILKVVFNRFLTPLLSGVSINAP
jgi:hypothetical protein